MPKAKSETEMQLAEAASARATKSTAARATRPAASARPKQGLYDPRNEHDACGVGFIANLKNEKSHRIVAERPADRAEPRPIAARSAPIR